ncbi:L-lactate permease [Phenylobacterium sp.]|uniref:L-lactate permease n=1 Tax=Phenylobacterium sp. TaxID=1871053 RepID=UPI002731FB3F|nr:L-lactate permease [Phenylobacterium sp.]MDP1875256.1 L-lactate permease [Phenylobacterium sp.]MDP3489731.1 L-lactate permease [Phenylobacterium sp.]
MTAVLALLPLGAVVGLMLGLKWRAGSAGLAGLVVAVGLAWTVFGLGQGQAAPFGPAGMSGGALLEAGFTSLSILWIIFPALVLHELQSRSGALLVLREAVGRISPDPRTQVVLIAWFFGLFMEGAAGFGVPVALTAPLLAGLGFPPVRAVVLALLGHAAGVSFGALGTPILAQAELMGASALAIGQETALLNLALGWFLLAALIWLAGERPPTVRDGLMGIAAAVCFYLPFLALALWVGPELPTAGGALIGGGLFALFSARRRRPEARGRLDLQGRSVVRALLPYGVIVLLVLATRLIGPLAQTLQGLAITWSLGEVFGGRLSPLYHPGGVLAAGLVLGGIAQGRNWGDFAEAAAAAVARLGPVALALFVMLALSRIMVHSGMIAALAGAAAGSAGIWPLLAPSIGALGAFVTGSATASNILLTPFQTATAEALDLPQTRMAAAQGVGAGVGNIISPHNIIAGAATVGLKGEEGAVLRQTAGICLFYLAAAGVLAFLLT